MTAIEMFLSGQDPYNFALSVIVVVFWLVLKDGQL